MTAALSTAAAAVRAAVLLDTEIVLADVPADHRREADAYAAAVHAAVDDYARRYAAARSPITVQATLEIAGSGILVDVDEVGIAWCALEAARMRPVTV